jgi:hypothetical protein
LGMRWEDAKIKALKLLARVGGSHAVIISRTTPESETCASWALAAVSGANSKQTLQSAFIWWPRRVLRFGQCLAAPNACMASLQ